MEMGLWLPPDIYYESVEEYAAARLHASWGVKDADVPRVAHTTIAYAIGDGWMNTTVSTVFLMIDHGWGEGPPVLWETMVFGWPGSGDWLESDADRYTSACDATRGHQEMVCRTELALDMRNYPVLATVTSRCKWWTEASSLKSVGAVK